MSYETVLTQVREAPEACLDEISNYIEYVIYRYTKQEQKKQNPKGYLHIKENVFTHFEIHSFSFSRIW